MIEALAKVRVIALKKDVERAVAALYSFGAVQVTRSAHGTFDVPTAHFAKLSEALIELRALEKTLSLANGIPAAQGSREELLKRYYALEQDVQELKSAQQEGSLAQQRVLDARSRIAALEPFEKLSFRVQPEDSLIDFRVVSPVKEELLLQELAKAKADVVRFPYGKQQLLLVAVRKGASLEKAMAFAGKEFAIPAFAPKTYSEELKQLRAELTAAEKSAADAHGFLSHFTSNFAKEIVSLRKGLEVYSLQAELPNKFGATNDLNVIECWVPERSVGALEKALKQELGDRFVLERMAFKKSEQPITLRNPSVARPFEFLIRFFSLPRSDEVDPTLIFLLSFPLMFGMILGDIGYGALGVLLSLFFMLKMKGTMQSLGSILLFSSIWTMIFGFIYGEIFGLEHLGPIELHPIIHRAGHDLTALMGLVLAAGVVQIALGFALGFYSNYKAKHMDHAYAKAGWLIFFVGAVVAFLTAGLGMLPSFMTIVGGIAALVGVALVAKFEGGAALIEIPGLLSNSLSYLRLMALGLSGVVLAAMINGIPVGAMFTEAFAKGDTGSMAVALITALFATVLFVLGHGLAFALGMFESFIHPLRLHYVEFFSKFYKGGGVPFTPLRDTEVK